MLHQTHSRMRKRRKTRNQAGRHCSHLNQSLMELGAIICTPRSPRCAICPVQKLCVARKQNLQDQLPNLGKRAETTARRFIAFVVERDGKFLVRQRPAGVVNAHLWEFPNIETNGIACEAVGTAAKALGLSATETEPFCIIKHSITRYHITLEVQRASHLNPRSELFGVWRTRKQLEKLALPSAHGKILTRLAFSPKRRLRLAC